MIGGVCKPSGPPSRTPGPPSPGPGPIPDVCNTQCSNDSNCSGSSECPSCIGNTCQPNRRGFCGEGCDSDGECTTAACPSCIGGTCEKPATACIGDEGALRTALQAGGAHKLCAQAIVVSHEIVSSASGVQLSCEGGGGCTIKGTNKRNRILNLSGSSWTITGITFHNDGGGVSQVRQACLELSSSETLGIKRCQSLLCNCKHNLVCILIIDIIGIVRSFVLIYAGWCH
jgi:hypothetical protein